jgi:hypothetical protein
MRAAELLIRNQITAHVGATPPSPEEISRAQVHALSLSPTAVRALYAIQLELDALLGVKTAAQCRLWAEERYAMLCARLRYMQHYVLLRYAMLCYGMRVDEEGSITNKDVINSIVLIMYEVRRKGLISQYITLQYIGYEAYVAYVYIFNLC